MKASCVLSVIVGIVFATFTSSWQVDGESSQNDESEREMIGWMRPEAQRPGWSSGMNGGGGSSQMMAMMGNKELPVVETLYFMSTGFLFIGRIVRAFKFPPIVPIILIIPLLIVAYGILFFSEPLQSIAMQLFG